MKKNLTRWFGKLFFSIFYILFSIAVFAQQPATVHGKVTSDVDNDPLPGVTVTVKGVNRRSVTNENGQFSIIASLGDTLIFTSVGFVEKRVVVDKPSGIDVNLQSSIKQLTDVVVVGYATQKKTSMTAAVSTIKGEELVASPVADLSNALGGRLSGVLSKQTSGEAGSDGATIRIRGIATTGNSSALLIVDGIQRSYSDLDANSIQSVTVLKDAAAVAPYGLAGANGVILVTTKTGSLGAPTLSYNGYYGWQNPIKLAKTVNSYQYALLLNETYLNDHPGDITHVPYSPEALEGYRKVAERAPGADPDKYFNSNNLRDVIQWDAPITNHTLQITGGTDKIKYFALVGYLNQQSMLPNESVNKYNAMFNLESRVTKTTKVSFSLNMIRRTRLFPGLPVVHDFGILQGAYVTAPTEAIYYSNGYWGAGAQGYNLVGRLYTSGHGTLTYNTSYSSVSIEQQLPFIKGLSIKGTISYDPSRYYQRLWKTDPYYYSVDYTTTPYTFRKVESGTKPSYAESYSQTEAITGQGFINYNNKFGKHNFTGLFVVEARKSDYNYFAAGRRNYSIPIETLDQGSSAQADLSNGGNAANARQLGFVSRLNYDYNSKYLVEVSGRYDGHYYFAPGHRWGFFPAVSLGWRLSEEKFIKNNVKWIDNLKLRGSWGESGNLAGQAFQYLSTYGTSGEAYRLGGTLEQGLYEQSPANPEITWERQSQTDIGLEGVLWNGLLNFEVDYFRQKRNNMLFYPNQIVPQEYGIGLPQVNGGIMSNSGIEFSLGTSHKFSNGIIFNVTGNFTQARNKTIQIFENPTTLNDPNRRLTGRPLNASFGYVAIGYFQSQDEVDKSPKQTLGAYGVGDLKYNDLNNDGTIDAKDQTMIGNSGYPEIIFGLNPSASWKGFDVSLLFQGAAKSDVYAPGPGKTPGAGGGPYLEDVLDRWTPQNPGARYPRLSSNTIYNNYVGSSWWMEDGAYVRLKNFDFGYTIPRSWVSIIKIQSVRIYISGQNLLTWSKEIKNQDPESSAGGRYTFVNQKVFASGINVKF